MSRVNSQKSSSGSIVVLVCFLSLLLAGSGRTADTSALGYLQQMSVGERAGAVIKLELAEPPSDQVQTLINTIEAKWNSGHPDDALLLGSDLVNEVDLGDMSVIINWGDMRETHSTANWSTDAQIGAKDSISALAFDIHRGTGNLFVVLLGEGNGSPYFWTLYISSDGGATWNRKMTLATSNQIHAVSLTVVGSYTYVVYENASVGTQSALVRRFNVADGTSVLMPNGDPYRTIFSISKPDYIEEIKIVSSQDRGGLPYSLYMLAITSDLGLKFYTSLDQGHSWAVFSTGVQADYGLDVTFSDGYGEHWLYASYYDHQYYLKIDGFDGSSWTNLHFTYSFSQYADVTAISAIGDSVFCAYEYNESPTYTLYDYSTDGGSNWVGSTIHGSSNKVTKPAVSLRAGGGVGATYHSVSTFFGPGRFKWRPYSSAGSIAFQPATVYSDKWIGTSTPDIEHLGGGVFGVAYVSSTDYKTAWFARGAPCCVALTGNVDGDASDICDIGDLTALIGYLFIPPFPVPVCMAEANCDGGGTVDIGDLTTMINYLFISPFPLPAACP